MNQIEVAMVSNNGEGVIIKNKVTKGVLLRGYKKEEFKNLKKIKVTKNYGFGNN